MEALTFATIEKDGIEFYVSTDGKKTGMSQAGLSRCCGMPRSTLQNLLLAVDANETTVEDLKPFSGKVFISTDAANIPNNAKIISSEVCAEIITYCAFKSKNNQNKIAKETLAKFAMIGIDTWIKKITGFENENNLVMESKIDRILNILIPQAEEIKQIKAELNEMKPVVEEYTNVKHGIRTTFRGLETVIEHVKHEQHVLPTGNTYTLSEWLDIKGITLSHSGLRKLGRTVAESFKTCTVAQPKKKNYLKPNGKWSCNCTAYSEEHFPLLEMALNQFVQN